MLPPPRGSRGADPGWPAAHCCGCCWLLLLRCCACDSSSSSAAQQHTAASSSCTGERERLLVLLLGTLISRQNYYRGCPSATHSEKTNRKNLFLFCNSEKDRGREGRFAGRLACKLACRLAWQAVSHGAGGQGTEELRQGRCLTKGWESIRRVGRYFVFQPP